jgi:hypothetical protein
MAPPRSETARLLHLGHDGGHRREYQELFAPLFRLTPIVGKVSFSNILVFLRARTVLFGTIEDHYAGFVAVAFLRALVCRRTVGLFLRPQTCFKADDVARRTWKGWFFSSLIRVRGISVGTIIPFTFVPHYARIARFGVMDPHMWDKGVPSSLAIDVALTKMVTEQARGRRVLAFIGSVTSIKGIDFLLSLLTRPDWPEDRTFVVIAGSVAAELRGSLQHIQPSRALVIDRMISDAELDTVYLCSDWIWSCYRPDYDQASGIFGRAVQFGKVAVIRKGSQIDRMTKDLGITAIRLDYGNLCSAIEVLTQAPAGCNVANAKISARWKDEFTQTIKALL